MNTEDIDSVVEPIAAALRRAMLEGEQTLVAKHGGDFVEEEGLSIGKIEVDGQHVRVLVYLSNVDQVTVEVETETDEEVPN